MCSSLGADGSEAPQKIVNHPPVIVDKSINEDKLPNSPAEKHFIKHDFDLSISAVGTIGYRTRLESHLSNGTTYSPVAGASLH